MQSLIHTVIDGVPVVFQLLSVGPATPEAITIFERNLNMEINNIPLVKTTEGNLKVVKIGDNDNPSTTDIQKVERALINAKDNSSVNVNELIDRLNQIEQAMNEETPEKPWWTSRTILSNLVFILVTIAAVFGFNIQISEEIVSLIFVILGMVNIWIRKTSKEVKISSKIIP
jgi:hypothetical protein